MHLSPTVVYHGVTVWYSMYHGDYGTYVLSRRGIPWYTCGTTCVPYGIPWYDNMVPVCTMVPIVVVLWYTMVHLCGTTAIPWFTMVYHGNTMVILWYFSSRGMLW